MSRSRRNTTGNGTTTAGTAGQSPAEWTPSLAECVARVYGIDPLTEAHWRVISECREEWARSGKSPEPARLASLARLSTTELESLFPPGMLSLAWSLAEVAPPSNLKTSSASPAEGA